MFLQYFIGKRRVWNWSHFQTGLFTRLSSSSSIMCWFKNSNLLCPTHSSVHSHQSLLAMAIWWLNTGTQAAADTVLLQLPYSLWKQWHLTSTTSWIYDISTCSVPCPLQAGAPARSAHHSSRSDSVWGASGLVPPEQTRQQRRALTAALHRAKAHAVKSAHRGIMRTEGEEGEERA